jgi:hypothetical protein
MRIASWEGNALALPFRRGERGHVITSSNDTMTEKVQLVPVLIVLA